MSIVTAVVWIVFGLILFGGQSISALNFKLAQRLGLQETDDATDPVFRRLELNAARWDVVVLWTLPVAGLLLAIEHPLWPVAALIAGGVHLDCGGREIVKVLGLRAHGVKTGSPPEVRKFFGVMAVMATVGVWCIAAGLAAIV